MTSKIPLSNTQRAHELFGAVGARKTFDLMSLGLPFSERADGFKFAADLLVEAPGSKRNSLVYPVCYLYRHCLELWLKHLIVMAEGYLRQDLLGKKIKNHDLAELWKICRAGLKKANPGDERWSKESFDEVEECIDALASFDEKGEVFRYDVNTRGERWQLAMRSVDLEKMRKAVSSVVDIFDIYSHEMKHRLDTREWSRP